MISSYWKPLPHLRSIVWLTALAIIGSAHAANPPHAAHPFEIQDNGSIQAATLALTATLGLTPGQSAAVAKLMHERAAMLRQQLDAANNSLRQKAEPLLTVAQRQQVPWPAVRWTSIARWRQHVPSLTPEQLAALDPFVKERNQAVRAALSAGQKHYTDGMDTLLSRAQKSALDIVDGADPVVHIPMR